MPRQRRRRAQRRSRRRSSPRRRGPRRVALAALVLAALVVAIEAARWPDVARLAGDAPTTTAFLERASERLAGEGRPAPSLRWVPRARISPALQHAVVASEDMNFFRHRGFDWGELRAAVTDTLEEGKRLRGASTITQQLAKNLWLSPSRNPWRKVRELLLTRELERKLGKHRILEIYLNVVEFGDGIYGAENAARHYWGISAAELTTRQAVELAAGLPAPRRWHPGSESARYAQRVRSLQERVERSDWIRGQL